MTRRFLEVLDVTISDKRWRNKSKYEGDAVWRKQRQPSILVSNRWQCFFLTSLSSDGLKLEKALGQWSVAFACNVTNLQMSLFCHSPLEGEEPGFRPSPPMARAKKRDFSWAPRQSSCLGFRDLRTPLMWAASCSHSGPKEVGGRGVYLHNPYLSSSLPFFPGISHQLSKLFFLPLISL